MIESAPTIAHARALVDGRGAGAARRRRADLLVRRAGAAARRAGGGRLGTPLLQTPVSGSTKLDRAGGLPVAVEGGDDRADLLVAGAQQERRRAAVALHADDVDARVGVGELVDAVRRHRCRRSAGSGRSAERARAAPRRGRRGRAAARPAARGRGGSRWWRSPRRPPARARRRAMAIQLAVALGDRAGLEAGDELDGAVVDEPADRLAERAALGQLVGAAAAELVARARRGGPPTRSRWPARCSRSATRSTSALKAEWPVPTTSTRLPA